MLSVGIGLITEQPFSTSRPATAIAIGMRQLTRGSYRLPGTDRLVFSAPPGHARTFRERSVDVPRPTFRVSKNRVCAFRNDW